MIILHGSTQSTQTTAATSLFFPSWKNVEVNVPQELDPGIVGSKLKSTNNTQEYRTCPGIHTFNPPPPRPQLWWVRSKIQSEPDKHTPAAHVHRREGTAVASEGILPGNHPFPSVLIIPLLYSRNKFLVLSPPCPQHARPVRQTTKHAGSFDMQLDRPLKRQKTLVARDPLPGCCTVQTQHHFFSG